MDDGWTDDQRERERENNNNARLFLNYVAVSYDGLI